MPGLGTLINVIAIIIGGIFGSLFGKLLKEEMQSSLTVTCGLATLFIGISGAMEGMLSADGNMIKSGKGLMIVVVLVLGAIIGEIIDFEGMMERFAAWLKIKTGNAKDTNFINAFLTATFTVCIGAMAVVGSIQDGLQGDYSILATKAILDLIIILVMTSSMGKGCVFSFIPVAILQGGVTILSKFIAPLMNDLALSYLSMVGSILIFGVGINLVFGKKVRVANLLPAIILAVAAAYIPFFN